VNVEKKKNDQEIRSFAISLMIFLVFPRHVLSAGWTFRTWRRRTYHYRFPGSRDCRSVHLSLIARARRFTYVNASLGEQGVAKGVAAARENAPRETIIPFLRRAAYRATLYLLSAWVRLITSSEFNGVHKSPVQCWEALKIAISVRMSHIRNVTPHISIRATRYPQ